jgi:hypothetical protein
MLVESMVVRCCGDVLVEDQDTLVDRLAFNGQHPKLKDDHTQVIAHCCKPTRRPRFVGGTHSLMYTGTCADWIPTQKPLMIRPTTSMGIFCEAQMIAEPITQITQPIMIALRRPRMSDK